MNQQDIEVAIEVLKERQRVQANHLKDVDECCGKLKGSTSQEFRILGERISALERSMENSCKDVEVEVRAIEERIKSQCETTKNIKHELDEIHKTYRNVTIEFILAVLLGIVALFIKL